MLKVILATAVLFGSFAFAEGEDKAAAPAPTEQTAPKAGKKAHTMKHEKKMEKTEKTEKKSE